jgi:hypothetical protein
LTDAPTAHGSALEQSARVLLPRGHLHCPLTEVQRRTFNGLLVITNITGIVVAERKAATVAPALHGTALQHGARVRLTGGHMDRAL